MKDEQVLDAFQRYGALLDGHFLLTSGLHSNCYIQCALVLQHPEVATQLGAQLAEFFKDIPIDLVAGPALGGVLVAQEVARALGVRALFAEREQEKMCLRRGFFVAPGERALVVEDVVTTGGSTREVIDVVTESGAQVVGVGALIDRRAGNLDLGVPFHALLSLEIATYHPETCPLCRSGLPAVKPGSRKGGVTSSVW
jgi:orotate phosphoribosyltransferase